MKVVFSGAFALIVLGIILYFAGVSASWVVFCVTLGVGLILISMGSDTPILLGIGIALLVVAAIAFVAALVGHDRQLPQLWP
jgi:hypothetical protein